MKDPSRWKLLNEGVANVNDEPTVEALAVLRYELETFVCDGQYQKGLVHILETYLKNIDQPEQPAAWVSGFFGSGKSHLVKMMRALWVDTKFSDGATARGIANLPADIKDLFTELSTQARRHGNLFAASGTLGAGAGHSVRLALLRIIFKAAGLPASYHLARFVLWLNSEGILEQVRNLVEEKGYDWQEELDHFYVAEGLHQALVEIKPNLFSSTAICVETLNNLYPFVQDISNDEMVRAIRQTLTCEGKFPLTLLVLDEVQQYIGEDRKRSSEVQEAAEECCKRFGGKILLIGTGQTAVTGTDNLKKLEGRFTVRVELSDTDVEAVIRKVILAKKPGALGPIEQVMQANLGEISRHLAGTSFAHRQSDHQYFASDYPLLPVRRRFWEYALRVLDQTGTDSQLRNQLSMVHKAIQINLELPLGHVIPADYLYFDSAEKLLQSRMLPRKAYELTLKWNDGSDDEQLMARACGLVYLINKLSDSNPEVGIKATADAIADLMVEDLSAGSGNLRSRLATALDGCELLMKVGDEYRIQTAESAAWSDEYAGQRNKLANEIHRVESERDDRIRSKFGELVKGITLRQGQSRVPRELHPVFENTLPAGSDQRVTVWVRHGWITDENIVRADARQAGNDSPVIFVYIPRRSADDLRHQIIKYKAANSTLELRGVPSTPEGSEARAAMETTMNVAEGQINDLLNDAFSGVRVFQGGGHEILGYDLRSALQEAAGNALQRLYDRFHLADQQGWDRVYSQAKQGSPDALRAVGYQGEPDQNEVCKALLSYIGGGKKGAEVRQRFEAAPYGWSRDAVDGALQVLLTTGLLRAQDERGQTVDAKNLERKAIGKSTFKVEATTVTAPQRIQIRKLMLKAGCKASPGEELRDVSQFLETVQELAGRAGGEPPRPCPPDSTILEDVHLASGNEKLLLLYNRREELTEAIEQWRDLAERIEARLPSWLDLQKLLDHAGSIKAAREARQQAQVIERERLLLTELDPVLPLAQSLEDALRSEIAAGRERYLDKLTTGLSALAQDLTWQQLSIEKAQSILEQCGIEDPAGLAPLEVGTRNALIETLGRMPLSQWNDRIAALTGRFQQARELAARALEPEARLLQLPHRIIKTEAEMECWLNEVRAELTGALAKGPVVIN